MGYVDTRPLNADNLTLTSTMRRRVPSGLPAICPKCGKGIYGAFLREHLQRSAERGGHGYDPTHANLWASRAIALAEVAMREIREAK